MAEKKITRKVIGKKDLVKEAKEVVGQTEESNLQRSVKIKKACFFCQGKTNPSYTDIVTLRRFTTDRAKIVARTKNNLCARHQRITTKQIKYARHLGLLPFSPKV